MKILLFDIETSPILANVWSLWSEARDMKFVDVDWYVLSWSAKWLGDKKTIVRALPDYINYKRDMQDDSALVSELWKLLDEADIVIAHNGVKFDCKKINARFILNGLEPPSPYRVIDTLLEARSQFGFTSNRLSDLGQMFGLGKKVETGGFELWKRCIAGEMSAWRKMCKYNKQDVILLEKIYLKMRPWMKRHPNVAIYEELDDDPRCIACGSKNIQRRGYAASGSTGRFARFRCSDCGKWGRSRVNEISKDERKSLLSNIV